MLELKNIKKDYIIGKTHITALKDISLRFRKNEFVAILGQSGCGKSTMLNILGGLDRATEGQLIIDGIKTDTYKDRDWDVYRNHRIGFVFQNYNLIAHQNILANVEMALSLSGVSKKERRERAVDALTKVGLSDQLNKKPGEMSGGQMQRVAIARAIVNNPDIILADEPTGALDSQTGIQVMEILKEIAGEKLVIVVTHNPDIADRYASRIITMLDGEVKSDSNPYEDAGNNSKKEKESDSDKKMTRHSMSFRTALSLSVKNLYTKKSRTILTSIAGSIGIIGIALIIAISSGMNNYITKSQKDAMAGTPLVIEKTGIGLRTLMEALSGEPEDKTEHEPGMVYGMTSVYETQNNLNNLEKYDNNVLAFKTYLEKRIAEGNIGKLEGVLYSYDFKMPVYIRNKAGNIILSDPDTLYTSISGDGNDNSLLSMFGVSDITGETTGITNMFQQIVPGLDGELINPVVLDNYEVVYGSWPDDYDEVVVVISSSSELDEMILYEMGLLDDEYLKRFTDKNYDFENEGAESFLYEEICSQNFKLILPSQRYVYDESKECFVDIGDTKDGLEQLYSEAVSLKITGIVRPMEEGNGGMISSPIGYTKLLTDYMLNEASYSEVLRQQKSNPDIDVLTGKPFGAEMLPDGIDEADIINQLMESLGGQEINLEELLKLGSLDIENMLSGNAQSSYEGNLALFGDIDEENLVSISLYFTDFEGKLDVKRMIAEYNQGVCDDDLIIYTDYMGIMLNSVTEIINAITNVLVALVAVSLVVSSIMIGVITLISVQERTREIGILRALGASKQDISRLFNAETMIVGFFSGIVGVVITYILCIPVNLIIKSVSQIEGLSAVLPLKTAVILVMVSIVLSLVAGVIPSRSAASKDPVVALRQE